MIISHKYKFLFIGLPFSASSAISKELYLNYEGTSFLRKHSLYHEFKKVASKKEQGYFVFAVLRNPMEIVVSMYEKMRVNAKGNFTNPKLFAENGAHITKKQRVIFDFIHNNKATFQQYFDKFFDRPYDNLASMTTEHCDYVIRYENIAEDYLCAMKKAGVKNPRPLPVANKTAGKKEDFFEYYTNDIREKAIFVFAPFLEKYSYSFPPHWKQARSSIKSRIQFRALSILRKIYYKHLKSFPKNDSMEGTIYGEIQKRGGNNIN